MIIISLNPPDIKGQVTKTRVFNPSVAADTDINLDANDPKFNQEVPNPIINIDVFIYTVAGPILSNNHYTVADRGTPGALAAGQFGIVDEDTFRLGDPTNVAGNYFMIDITYVAGRTKNI